MANNSIASSVLSQPAGLQSAPALGRAVGQSIQQGIRDARGFAVKQRQVEIDEKRNQIAQQQNEIRMQAFKSAQADQGFNLLSKAAFEDSPQMKKLLLDRAEQSLNQMGTPVTRQVLDAIMKQGGAQKQNMLLAFQDVVQRPIGDPIKSASFFELVETLQSAPEDFNKKVSAFLTQLETEKGKTERAEIIATGQTERLKTGIQSKESLARQKILADAEQNRIKNTIVLAEGNRQAIDKGRQERAKIDDKLMRQISVAKGLKALKKEKTGIADLLRIKGINQFNDSPAVRDAELRLVGSVGEGIVGRARLWLQNLKDKKPLTQKQRVELLQGAEILGRQIEIDRLTRITPIYQSLISRGLSQSQLKGVFGSSEDLSRLKKITVRGLSPEQVIPKPAILKKLEKSGSTENKTAKGRSPGDPKRVGKALSLLMKVDRVSEVQDALGAKKLSIKFFEQALKRKLTDEERARLIKIGLE